MNSSSFFRGLPVPDFLQRKHIPFCGGFEKEKQKQEKTKTRMSSGEVWRACRLYCSPGRKGGVHSYRRVFAALDPLSPSRELVASERHSG